VWVEALGAAAQAEIHEIELQRLAKSAVCYFVTAIEA